LKIVFLVDAINVHTQRIESALLSHGHIVDTFCIADCNTEMSLIKYETCLISPLRKVPSDIYQCLPPSYFYASMAFEVLYEMIEKQIEPDSEFKYQVSGASGFIIDSDSVGGAIDRIFALNGKYLNIPYGVESKLFSKIELKNSGTIHIAAIRNWAEVHRQAELFSMLVELLEEQKDVIIHIAGSGKKKSETLVLLEKFLIRGQIIDHGNVSNSELVEILKMSHIYLNNSSIDGSSVSMLEAMAVGALIITTDTLENRRWVKPGIEGLLFNETPVPKIRQAIELIQGQSENYHRMIQTAQSRVINEANWDFNGKLLCKFLEGSADE